MQHIEGKRQLEGDNNRLDRELQECKEGKELKAKRIENLEVIVAKFYEIS